VQLLLVEHYRMHYHWNAERIVYVIPNSWFDNRSSAMVVYDTR
jgi:hypothetical protein